MNGADKNGGWLKLHRKILNWGWYDDPPTRGLFLHLLVKANWEDKFWGGFTVKSGQLVTSIAGLSKEIGFSIRQTRTAVEHLSSTNEITVKTTNKYTLITLVNWTLYQSEEETTTNKITSQMTNEPQTNVRQTNDKQKVIEMTNERQTELLTDGGLYSTQRQALRQTNDKQDVAKATTTKELRIKNKKNLQEELPEIPRLGSLGNVRLTDEEHVRLLKEYPDCADEAIEFLSLWIDEKGDKSKALTHNSTIRRWVIDAVRDRALKRNGLQSYQQVEKPKRNWV